MTKQGGSVITICLRPRGILCVCIVLALCSSGCLAATHRGGPTTRNQRHSTERSSQELEPALVQQQEEDGSNVSVTVCCSQTVREASGSGAQTKMCTKRALLKDSKEDGWGMRQCMRMYCSRADKVASNGEPCQVFEGVASRSGDCGSRTSASLPSCETAGADQFPHRGASSEYASTRSEGSGKKKIKLMEETQMVLAESIPFADESEDGQLYMALEGTQFALKGVFSNIKYALSWRMSERVDWSEPTDSTRSIIGWFFGDFPYLRISVELDLLPVDSWLRKGETPKSSDVVGTSDPYVKIVTGYEIWPKHLKRKIGRTIRNAFTFSSGSDDSASQASTEYQRTGSSVKGVLQMQFKRLHVKATIELEKVGFLDMKGRILPAIGKFDISSISEAEVSFEDEDGSLKPLSDLNVEEEKPTRRPSERAFLIQDSRYRNPVAKNSRVINWILKKLMKRLVDGYTKAELQRMLEGWGYKDILRGLLKNTAVGILQGWTRKAYSDTMVRRAFSAVDWGKGAINWVWEKAGDAGEWVQQKASDVMGLYDDAMGAIREKAEQLQNLPKDVYNAAAEKMGNMWTFVSDWMWSDVGEEISEIENSPDYSSYWNYI
uniref:C2 domain-containing protein n=1 Tax=Chromera velia CCMP2878 TaxID=1169474 RepID=A0A0G4FML0_9ALVE|eukprot:Cvel_17765.t1-p1 / transcript=Cvel_17765.t1 / gene=Cvel_17765 / organism=Chromera_velia_CCMP2878 / gene_product=hypothetical protein / transcript_product=hypothetical protein / location=Cvel_scaffold1436:26257-29303(-) / protein_length=605 / sequence_SO=supercontig / SO=protein_coding / is_pseudo=false